jgi:hypothetical protein
MSFEEPNHRVSVKANLVGMTLPALTIHPHNACTVAKVCACRDGRSNSDIEPTITHDASVSPLWPPQRLH